MTSKKRAGVLKVLPPGTPYGKRISRAAFRRLLPVGREVTMVIGGGFPVHLHRTVVRSSRAGVEFIDPASAEKSSKGEYLITYYSNFDHAQDYYQDGDSVTVVRTTLKTFTTWKFGHLPKP